ncbi:MAG: hypothetical protein NTZ13_02775 [Candidatus Parcubacteria bacterium]|nr:hypothetical protein [Candidatus Parcubacteria bacterium]
MNSLEKMWVQEEEKGDKFSILIHSFMKDFPPANCSDEELRKGEVSLDAKMAEMNREDLLNLAMDIRQRLEEPHSGFADENTYVRLATVYGAACAQLEKLDKE